MVVLNKKGRYSRMAKNKLGMIARTKQRFDQYVLIRKYRMKQERDYFASDRKSTRLNSSHLARSRMPSSA